MAQTQRATFSYRRGRGMPRVGRPAIIKPATMAPALQNTQPTPRALAIQAVATFMLRALDDDPELARLSAAARAAGRAAIIAAAAELGAPLAS